MIRRGKLEGWLSLPTTAIRPWAEFYGASFNGIRIGSMPGLEEKGSSVIAERTLVGGNEPPLMVVPRDLILSLEYVEAHAKCDQHLRKILDALGAFGRTSRGAILVFLLMQATIACPAIPTTIGVQSPLTEYIKFLPEENLPTFWSPEEHEQLLGTSLKPAVSAKLKSLDREFQTLRAATERIDWCAKHWWDEFDGQITFDDWKQVDAMYRSRALEYPGIGDCMVPCIDMANHAAGDYTAALYETDGSGNAILLMRDDVSIEAGGEVTISYGDEKGACEMIFSYGFIENSANSARAVFLDLAIPNDDPLKAAKAEVLTSPPGCRIFDKEGDAGWESDFVWLICVNEEDGLGFDVLQSVDGEQELRVFWKGTELEDTTKLRSLLFQEELWDIYQLRAVALIQARVEDQLRLLYGAEVKDLECAPENRVRQVPRMLAHRLRTFEMELLEKAYEELEGQKSRLVGSNVVQQYLGMSKAVEEDFT